MIREAREDWKKYVDKCLKISLAEESWIAYDLYGNQEAVSIRFRRKELAKYCYSSLEKIHRLRAFSRYHRNGSIWWKMCRIEWGNSAKDAGTKRWFSKNTGRPSSIVARSSNFVIRQWRSKNSKVKTLTGFTRTRRMNWSMRQSWTKKSNTWSMW